MSGRKVFVSSDMSVDERLLLVGQQQCMASLLWPWLLTALDDWGRSEAAPLRLKARVWPMYDAVSVALIDEALTLFAEVGLIERYDVAGRAYLRVPPASWWKWQTHIHRDKRADDRSRIPTPEGESAREVAREVPRESAEFRAGSRSSARLRAAARDSAPSPSLSPSLSPTPATPDGQDASGERANVRPREADATAAAEMVAMGDVAADAALSLVVTPTPLSAHPATQTAQATPPSRPPSSHPASPPANVTPLRAGRPLATPQAGPVRVPSRADPVWDACIAAMGHNGVAPSNRVERGKWAKGIQALKESLAADGSPPGEIGIRAQRYRARFGPSVPLNPMALAGNWTVLAHDVQEGVRHGQRQGNSGKLGYAQAGRSSRAGGPAVGTPEYYAAAIAEQYG
jgi:hypothetical protein